MAELSDLKKKYGTGNLTPEQMMYMESLRPQSGSEVAQRIIRESSPELKPAPGNFFQRAATGAGQAADLVNKYLPKALVVPDKYVQPSKLTQTVRETQVPTSFKFFPSVDTATGEMQPAGFGEGRMPAGKILDAIKPADLIGLTGAQKTYSALGYGQRPEPLDVLDTFGLGAGMTQLGKAGFRGASSVARAGAPYVAEGLTELSSKYGVDPRMYVVKPKGGNWLTGAIDDQTGKLKTVIAGHTAEDRIALHERLLADPELNQDQLDRVQYQLGLTKRDAAVDKWIDKKLVNYIKNEMATPEDSIRLGIEKRAAAAEELKATNQSRIDKMVSDIERAKAAGKDTTLSENDLAAAREKFADEEYIASQGLHHDIIPEEGWNEANIWEPEYLSYARKKAGFPEEGMATHPASKDWEIKSDSEITDFKAGDLQSPHLADTPLLEENPWINKVDPNTRINRLDQGAIDSAGFTHMIDELKNAVDPESALPPNLKISTKDLEKMTVDDVSALVGKINAWRNVQKTKSDLQIANNPAMHTFKEYPPESNPKGVSWRQIKRPEGYSNEEAEKFVREATKYEGDIMRHCVGGAGHCEPLLRGDVEIYTLRDAKGEPHVTIEVEPGKWDWAFIKEDGGNPLEVIEEAEMRMGITPENRSEVVKNWGSEERYQKQKELNDLVDEIYKEKTGKTPPSRILEIKGKNNQKPKDEYIPFVQDFVKSQNWADVGDIQNTGLFRVTEGQKLPGFSQEIPPGYYTLDEFQRMAVENEMPEEILDSWMSKLKEQSRRGYAEGGEVEMAEGGSVYDVLDMVDAHFSNQLRKYKSGGVVHMEEGGVPETKQEFRAVEPSPIMGSISVGLGKASNFLKSRPMPESVMDYKGEKSEASRDIGGLINSALSAVDTFFVNDLAKTAERMSYGDRLTSGSGQTLQMLPETVGAASMVAPPAAKLAGKTAKVVRKVAPEVAETAAQMAERYAMQPMYAVPPAKRMSKAEAEAAGLWHPISDVKLRRPYQEMTATTIDNPAVIMPERKILTPEDLYKKAGFPKIGDRAATGKILTHINDQKLAWDVPLTGGPEYSMANLSPKPGKSAAWESGQGKVTALQNRIEEAAENADDVVGVYSSGSLQQVDFNTMMSDALAAQLPGTKLTKKAKTAFDKDVRKFYPEFVGVDSPKLREQLLDKKNGVLRTAFVKRMNNAEFQNMGFPDVPATRKAISEVSIMEDPIGTTGFTMAKMDTGRRTVDPKHPSGYPIAMAGEYIGGLETRIPFDVMFNTQTKQRRLLGAPTSGDYRSYELAQPVQVFDQEWLDTVSKYLEQQKKLIGKKKGGKVGGKKPLSLTEQEQKIVDYHRNTIAGKAVGMDQRGRPVTVYTTTIPVDERNPRGAHANVPGYVGGKIRSREELQQLFKDEIAQGRWPVYRTGEEAGRRAGQVHSIMDDEIGAAEGALRQMKTPNRVFTDEN
jgi:hypothetical protein